MTDDRTELREAAERLDSAREASSDDETGERLESLAERLRTMADSERGPDHGTLARLEHNLQDVQSALDDEQAETVQSALGDVRAYRETVEGV
ncbi:DUF7553 family protein [Halorussus aquaticus]|uniref:DUF4404 family protein n=1 Tax=Halorussus aquaticus TaxID=2953748 RepID=A0ABD5Q193_9EURY|nr:hypothetical protein [Halorussus aquaticus]